MQGKAQKMVRQMRSLAWLLFGLDAQRKREAPRK